MPDYPPGTPSWVELSSPDAEASSAFYAGLFDWGTTEPATDTGGYRRFQHQGKDVAGLMPHMQEGQPTAWVTYIAVADADETARTVTENGGGEIVEPMDVLDLGRFGVFSDPSGAAFGVWQAKSFAGAELVNEPNSLCWNECLTRDAERNKPFYSAVFGWNAGRPQFEGAPESYTVWERGDGQAVGGMMQMSEPWFPPDVPPHWGVCFAVGDADATVAEARELGATITNEPMDMPIGRFAGITDPQGASFTVMQMA